MYLVNFILALNYVQGELLKCTNIVVEYKDQQYEESSELEKKRLVKLF